MAQFIQENELATTETAKVFKVGLMEQNTKGVEKTTKLKAMESFGIVMETYSKATDMMKKQMEKEFTVILMGLNTQGTGLTTYKMGLVMKYERTAANMKGFIRMEKKMDLANTPGLMEASILANEWKIALVAKGLMSD